jgi:hypothetical protein
MKGDAVGNGATAFVDLNIDPASSSSSSSPNNEAEAGFFACTSDLGVAVDAVGVAS